jgi:hypothetical protein
MEASGFMDLVKSGQQHTLPSEYEQIGANVAQSWETRSSRAEFNPYNYEEALEIDPKVGKWIRLA